MARRAGRIAIVSGALLAVFAAAAAPSSPPVGTLGDQLTRGATLYAQSCATAACHGPRGEGLKAGGAFRVWPLVGRDFQRRNPNAQVVFDVVRSGSEAGLRRMTDQEIYDAIAYELGQNGVRLTDPLTAENAMSTATGPGARRQAAAVLYPPSPAVRLLDTPARPRVSSSGATSALALRVDQITQADAVGGRTLPQSSRYVIVVLAMRALTPGPRTVDPGFLRLVDGQGGTHDAQGIDVGSPIERLHRVTIDSQHGTAALAVFVLPSGRTPRVLRYDDGTGRPVTVVVAP